MTFTFILFRFSNRDYGTVHAFVRVHGVLGILKKVLVDLLVVQFQRNAYYSRMLCNLSVTVVKQE